MPPRKKKGSSARLEAIAAVRKQVAANRAAGNTNAQAEERRRLEEAAAAAGVDLTGSGENLHHSNSDYRHHYHDHDDDIEDDDDEDDDDDSPPPLEEEDEDGCLHCRSISNDIQVRCDECQSYICQSCHWCHEFQANHEIRVCDRCDAFYCRTCDEMDQCDDCGEVVCASCSTLLSCKFCGGGLCEECATACGRCGIVLCSRDAKFAVDCDTCRLSYCLVCLASGSKDPCVRCGHRPSKRMEQLVHLRLKSIYKAFKQSSRSSSGPGGGGPSSHHHSSHHHSTNHASNNSSQKGGYHGRGGNSNVTISSLDADEDDDVVDDPQALLQAAASAASSKPSVTTAQAKEMVDKYMAEKKKADAAAEALLAELDEEEEAQKTKKNKKKKKKKKQQEKKEEETKAQEDKKPAPVADKSKAQTETPNTKKQNSKASPNKVSSVQSQNSMDDDDKAEEPDLIPPEPEIDPVETQLAEYIEAGNAEGIERILESLKGVPGKAALRKNAKKALKRMRTEEAEIEAMEEAQHDDEGAEVEGNPQVDTLLENGELLKIVSENKRKSTNPTRIKSNAAPPKAECVMHMSPAVVGWVIGKGGQRIRDLMEESGAKIWIDQTDKQDHEPRVVYISGSQKSVDAGVRMVKDLVSKAPIDGNNVQSSEYEYQLPQKEAPPAVVAPPMPKVQPVPQSTPTPAVPTPPPPAAANPPAAAATISQQEVPTPVTASALEYLQDGGVMQVVTCEPRFVPLLIGRRGWTIKQIQDTTGARVDIDQIATPRRIMVSGNQSNVENAVKMVRDVLNYPHAQDGALDEAALAERIRQQALGDNLESGTQSPPPSSHIVIGDSKSLISASSSLSSTPEPSQASMSKNFAGPQLQTGPLIPPEYPPAGYPAPPPGNAFLRPGVGLGSLNGMQQSSPGMAPPGGLSMYGNGPLGMQNQNSQGFGIQQSHQQGYGHGIAGHNQNMQGAPLGMNQGLNNNIPPHLRQGMGMGSMQAPGQPTMNQPSMYGNSQQLPGQNTAPGGGLPSIMNLGNQGAFAGSAFSGAGSASTPSSSGLFGYQQAGQQSNVPPNHTGGFGKGPGQNVNATSGLGLNLGGNLNPSSGNHLSQPPNPVEAGGDADIINSLFGPSGGTTNANTASADQNLLSGFQGLGINGDDLDGGLWGSSLPGLGGAKNDNAGETSLLAGLQPLGTSQDQQQQQQHQQHPPESRFHWGPTNA